MNRNRNQTVTIEDVAREASVSISTVSNVLNGREGRMRAETLARVRQVIRDLGFQPNQSARRLKTGHLPTIGLLVPSIANPFFGALARWIEEAANSRGYGVLLCNTQRDAQREHAYAQAFMAQGVQGVIVGSSLQAQEHLAPLIERGLAVLSFDRTAERASSLHMDYVSLDNYRAGAMAAEHLLALGHRRIGYVSAPLRSINRNARLDGARDACTQAGVQLHTEVHDIPGGQTEMEMAELGRRAGRLLPANGHGATGVVAMNDMLAIGLMAGLREVGLAVPRDVSVIGIDDMFLGRYLDPALSTVRQPMQQMAHAAVEQVLLRMHHRDEPVHERVFAPELVIRESTAPSGRGLQPRKQEP